MSDLAVVVLVAGVAVVVVVDVFRDLECDRKETRGNIDGRFRT